MNKNKMYDFFLRVASKKELTEQVTTASSVGIRQPWKIDDLTDLNLPALKRMMDQVRRGHYTPRFPEFAEIMEESDAHYRAVLQQRRLAVTGIPRRVQPAGEDAASQLHAQLVEHVMGEPNFDELAHDLLDGLSKSFGLDEIVWKGRDSTLMPDRFHRVDPRWVFWGQDGTTPYIINDDGTGGANLYSGVAQGSPLSWGKFIMHAPSTKSGLPARGGLAFPCATLFLLKNYAIRDWWAFADIFGLPLRVGKYGKNATTDDKRTLQSAIAQLAANCGVAIPESMDIEVITAKAAGGSGTNLFIEMAKWVDSQVSKAVVGQTMTTDDGSSLAQAQVHMYVRQDLIEDDARQLATTLNRQLVRYLIDFNFGKQKKYPQIIIAEEHSPNIEIWTKAFIDLADAGLEISVDHVRERLGLPAPEKGQEILRGTLNPSEPAPGGTEPPAKKTPKKESKTQTALHAAQLGDGGAFKTEWAKLSQSLSEPLKKALEGAEDPEAFLRQAINAAPADSTMTDNVAIQRFFAYVDGTTGSPERFESNV